MINKFLRALRLRAEPPTLPLEDRLPTAESLAASPVIDVTDTDFAEIVLQSAKLAVVDFWADWCQPCTFMSGYVNMLAKAYGDEILVAALDVDENPQTPETHTVMGLPTLIFFQNGAEVDRVVGVIDYEELRARCQRIRRTD